jgi:hypothetical protein
MNMIQRFLAKRKLMKIAKYIMTTPEQYTENYNKIIAALPHVATILNDVQIEDQKIKNLVDYLKVRLEPHVTAIAAELETISKDLSNSQIAQAVKASVMRNQEAAGNLREVVGTVVEMRKRVSRKGVQDILNEEDPNTGVAQPATTSEDNQQSAEA